MSSDEAPCVPQQETVWESAAYVVDPYMGVARHQGIDARKANEETRNNIGSAEVTLLPKRSRKSSRPTTCQIDGCGRDLASEKAYLQRYSVCDQHFKADMALLHGLEVRFCQQCNKFQDLREFDGARRSCAARSKDRNLRRRLQTTQQRGPAGEDLMLLPVLLNAQQLQSSERQRASGQQEQQQSGSPGVSGGAGGGAGSDESGGRPASGDACLGGSAAARGIVSGEVSLDPRFAAAGAAAAMATATAAAAAGPRALRGPEQQHHLHPELQSTGSIGHVGGGGGANYNLLLDLTAARCGGPGRDPRGSGGIIIMRAGTGAGSAHSHAHAHADGGVGGVGRGTDILAAPHADMDIDTFIPQAAHPYAAMMLQHRGANPPAPAGVAVAVSAHHHTGNSGMRGGVHPSGGPNPFGAAAAAQGRPESPMSMEAASGAGAREQDLVMPSFTRRGPALGGRAGGGGGGGYADGNGHGGGGTGGGLGWDPPAALALLEELEERVQSPPPAVPPQLSGQLQLQRLASLRSTAPSLQQQQLPQQGAGLLQGGWGSLGATQAEGSVGVAMLGGGGGGGGDSAEKLLAQMQDVMQDVSRPGVLGLGAGGGDDWTAAAAALMGNGLGATGGGGVQAEQLLRLHAVGLQYQQQQEASQQLLQQHSLQQQLQRQLEALQSGQGGDDLSASVRERRAALIRQQLLRQQQQLSLQHPHPHHHHQPNQQPQQQQRLLQQQQPHRPDFLMRPQEPPLLRGTSFGEDAFQSGGNLTTTNSEQMQRLRLVSSHSSGPGDLGDDRVWGTAVPAATPVPATATSVAAFAMDLSGPAGAGANRLGSNASVAVVNRSYMILDAEGPDALGLLERYALGDVGGAAAGTASSAAGMGLAAGYGGGGGGSDPVTAAGGPPAHGGGSGSGGDGGSGAGSSSRLLAAMFPGAGGREDALAARVCLKVFSCVPEELPGDMLLRLRRWATAADSDVLQIFMRPGCVHVIANVRHSRGGPAAVENAVLGGGDLSTAVKALRAAFDSCGLLRDRRVVVQAREGPQGAFEYDGTAAGGQARWVDSSTMAGSPGVVSVLPAAVPSGTPTLALLTGHHLLLPGTRFYARCGGRSYELLPVVPQPSAAVLAAAVATAVWTGAQGPPGCPSATATGGATTGGSSVAALAAAAGAQHPPMPHMAPPSPAPVPQKALESVLVHVPPLPCPGMLVLEAAHPGLQVMGSWAAGVSIEEPEAADEINGWLRRRADATSARWLLQQLGVLLDYDTSLLPLLRDPSPQPTTPAPTGLAAAAGDGGGAPPAPAPAITRQRPLGMASAAPWQGTRQSQPHDQPLLTVDTEPYPGAGAAAGDAVGAAAIGEHLLAAVDQECFYQQQWLIASNPLPFSVNTRRGLAGTSDAAPGALSAVVYSGETNGRPLSAVVAAAGPEGPVERRVLSSASADASPSVAAASGDSTGVGHAVSAWALDALQDGGGGRSGGGGPGHGGGTGVDVSSRALGAVTALQGGQEWRQEAPAHISDDTKVPDAPGRQPQSAVRRLLTHPLLHPGCRRDMGAAAARLLSYAVASGLPLLATGLLEWLMALEGAALGVTSHDLRAFETDPSAVAASAVTAVYSRTVRRAAAATGCAVLAAAAARGGADPCEDDLDSSQCRSLGSLSISFGAGSSSWDSQAGSSRSSSGVRAMAAGLGLLHLAVASGNSSMVQQAMDWADTYSRPWVLVERAGPRHATPLHLAAGLGDGGAVGRLLLSVGGPEAQEAWLMARNGAGWTPADIAAANGLAHLTHFCLYGEEPVAVEPPSGAMGGQKGGLSTGMQRGGVPARSGVDNDSEGSSSSGSGSSSSDSSCGPTHGSPVPPDRSAIAAGVKDSVAQGIRRHTQLGPLQLDWSRTATALVAALFAVLVALLCRREAAA